MARNFASTILDKVGRSYDIGKISITNFGNGADKILIEISIIRGNPTLENDPFLPPDLDIKLFDKIDEVTIIKLTFGQLSELITQAVISDPPLLEPQVASLFNSNSINYYLSGQYQVYALIDMLASCASLLPSFREKYHQAIAILPDELPNIAVSN